MRRLFFVLLAAVGFSSVAIALGEGGRECAPPGACGSGAGSSPLSHVIAGSGGPLERLWENLLEGDHYLQSWIEEFDTRMPDVVAFSGSDFDVWAASGCTISAINEPTIGVNTLLARSAGGGLFRVDTGDKNDAGVNVRCRPYRQMNPPSTATMAHTFNWPPVGTYEGFPGNSYSTNSEVIWAIGRVIVPLQGTALFFGMTHDDDAQIMVNTTGALSDAEWAPGIDGGWGFHFSTTQQLTFAMKKGATITTTTPAVDASSFQAVSLGFAWQNTPAPGDGNGRLQASYRVDVYGSGAPPGVWTPLGAALTGAVFPTTNYDPDPVDADDGYWPTFEALRNTVTGSVFFEHIVGGITKESF